MKSVIKYEKLMADTKLHMVSYELDTFIRNINKYWVANVDENNLDKLKQTIINTLYMVKIAMVLLHPVAPKGTENLAKFLKVSDDVFSWDKIDEPIYAFVEDPEHYVPTFLEPRQDFFKKHPSQLIVEENN